MLDIFHKSYSNSVFRSTITAKRFLLKLDEKTLSTVFQIKPSYKLTPTSLFLQKQFHLPL